MSSRDAAFSAVLGASLNVAILLAVWVIAMPEVRRPALPLELLAAATIWVAMFVVWRRRFLQGSRYASTDVYDEDPG